MNLHFQSTTLQWRVTALGYDHVVLLLALIK
jgi:hypothetical protein